MSEELKALLKHADRQVQVCQAKAEHLLEAARETLDTDARALGESDAVKATLDAALWQQIADEIRAYINRDQSALVDQGAPCLW